MAIPLKEIDFIGQYRVSNTVCDELIDLHKKVPETKIFSWLPITPEQENLFIRITIRGAWIGIGCLIALWIVVRFVGPAAGWWVPADIR